ncbi:MAG: hypothetical protein ACOYUB_01910 [Patescibacteria group bacterium]
MLTIVCGEDSGSSRNYFLDIKKKARDRDCEVVDIDAKSIGEILTWMADAPTLFSSKKVFFTQSLNKNISKRSNPKYLETVEKIARDAGSEVYDWEDNVPGRYLKIKEGVTVKEFKPDTSIFKVLDSCYPGNIKVFLDGVHDLSQGSEDIFTFIMLSRHVRNLMLISLGQVPPGMPSWQAARLKGQAAKWTTEKLVSFYDNLHKIDASLKTGTLPYSLASALDILAAYYL